MSSSIAPRPRRTALRLCTALDHFESTLHLDLVKAVAAKEKYWEVFALIVPHVFSIFNDYKPTIRPNSHGRR